MLRTRFIQEIFLRGISIKLGGKCMIKVYALHPWVNSVESLVKYLKYDNKNIINQLEWSPESPDYLFSSEHIYKNYKYFKTLKYLMKKNSKMINIFLGMELLEPDLNVFDYAIAYDSDFKVNDRIHHLIPSLFYNEIQNDETNLYDIKNEISFDDAKESVTERKFCNFIYSNGKAHPYRDNLFYKISEYKRVDSLGKHLNNMGNKSTRNDKNWAGLSADMKSNYKFTLAIENACSNGYTTEKILTSFLAHSVPIYWGDPDVSKYYNERAFINCHNYSSMDEVLERVKEIDSNDDLWSKMISEPWQTDEQYILTHNEIQDYQDWITHIFQQDIGSAKRVAIGSMPDEYLQYFFNSINLKIIFKSSKFGKLLIKIRNFLLRRGK